MLNKTQTTITAALVLTASVAIAAPDRDRFPIDISAAESKAAERFATMDTDGSGAIELTEFEAAKHSRRGHHSKHGTRKGKGHGRMYRGGKAGASDNPRRAAMQAQVAEEMFVILDTDSDGNVTKAEYAATDLRTARKLARKRAMFKQLDKDGSGALSQSELPNPVARIKQADADGDGQVTRDEMRAAHQKRSAS